MGSSEMLIGISAEILTCLRIALILADWLMPVIKQVLHRVRVQKCTLLHGKYRSLSGHHLSSNTDLDSSLCTWISVPVTSCSFEFMRV